MTSEYFIEQSDDWIKCAPGNPYTHACVQSMENSSFTVARTSYQRKFILCGKSVPGRNEKCLRWHLKVWRVKYQWKSARWRQRSNQPTNQLNYLQWKFVWFAFDGSCRFVAPSAAQHIVALRLRQIVNSLLIQCCECAAPKVQENGKKRKENESRIFLFKLPYFTWALLAQK